MEIVWGLKPRAVYGITMLVITTIVLLYILVSRRKTKATWLFLGFIGGLWLLSVCVLLGNGSNGWFFTFC